MKSEAAIHLLGALASDARLSVFRLLVRRGPEGFTPSEIAERLDIPAPTLSFHLKELMRAGLIRSRRQGRNLHYSADFGQMDDLIAFLTENCCSLAGEAVCRPAVNSRKRA
jgi:ArsR family transcriptional regulator, arsenate/arsenite/antimonite-responsive transcriptional repressor